MRFLATRFVRNGRVIAHGSGDTDTGTLECTVRRATGIAGTQTYRLNARNGSTSAAQITITCNGDVLYTSVLPALARASVTFAHSIKDGRIVVDVRCESLQFSVCERGPPEKRNGNPLLTAIVVVVITALIAIFVGVYELRKRRKVRKADEIVNAQNTAPETIAEIIEPPPVVSDVIVVQPADRMTTEIEKQNLPEIQSDFLRTDRIEVKPPDAASTYNARMRGATYDVWPVHRSPFPVTTIAIAILATALAGAAFLFGHPHVADIAAPSRILEGAGVDIPYAASGLGTLRYTVSALDGTRVAGDVLPQRNGSFHLAVPVVRHQQTYRVRLVLSGPFGDASNEATMRADVIPEARVITRSVSPPRIASFAVDRVRDGTTESILAYYDVNAEGGTIRLVDSAGFQYGIFPLAASGQSVFRLPANAAAGRLAVELRVTKSGMAAASRVAVPAVSGASPQPKPTGAASADEPPISVSDRVAASAPIRIRILRHYDALRVVLKDERAHEISSAAVAADRNFVEFRHPRVAVATQYTVEATYRFKNEADTIVLPVTVLPTDGG